MDDLQGVFHPENMGKIQQEMGRYRGPKMRFQISDNTCTIFNGEDAKG